MPALLQTDFKNLKLFRKGKVRDVYDLGDRLLIVATDRISAFDVVLPDGVPDKGKLLTQMTTFWFEFSRELVENHFITSDPAQYPPLLSPYMDQISHRSMLVKKTKPLEIECIVRGYITGSGWKEYLKDGTVCGIELPQGLNESEKLAEPIFTPSTKNNQGHDENITFREMEELVGRESADILKEKSIQLYSLTAKKALQSGIIIADTKFEFGMLDGNIILIDEILTPDSSRFWPVNGYEAGRSQASFDKQYVRDYLETLYWDKRYPGPSLPEDVLNNTRQKYIDALEMITGLKAA